MAYLHGVYPTEKSETAVSLSTTTQVQVVIGTAPIHMLDNPSEAVNKPILCESKEDCYKKIGYSTDFSKYTLCQSMFASFFKIGVAPVVFINVLNPEKHNKEVTDKEFVVQDNSILIDDAVILSTLKLTAASNTISHEDYVTEWVDEKLSIIFKNKIEGNVTATYKSIAPEKVTENDIIGSYDTETGVRTGTELIKMVYPMYGVIPFVLIAPGWTETDTVGAVLEQKTEEINGCFKGITIIDLDSQTSKTRSAVIKDKQARTVNANTIAVYPKIKKDGYVLSYSAWLAAIIMKQATENEGVFCKSPSNINIDIDDCITADGTRVLYDGEDGNELNGEGIVTIIARNGWYTWGNNTALYPEITDTKSRWIMARLAFAFVENEFIMSKIQTIDTELSPKNIENAVTEENIRLAALTAGGYILGGKMLYDKADNSNDSILNGQFKFRTQIATNIPTEVIENTFEFDAETVQNAILGGEQ